MNRSANQLLNAIIRSCCALVLCCGVTLFAEEADGIRRLTSDGFFKLTPRISPNGEELLYSQGRMDRFQLMKLDLRSNAKPERFDKSEVSEYEAGWSPDGNSVVYSHVKLSPGQGDLEVYVVNRDGSNPRLVFGTDGALSHEESPCWSPDGKRIALVSTRHGNQEIYTCTPDGKDLQRLTTDSALDKSPFWGRDGKIYFASGRWGDLELAVMNGDGSEIRRLTESKGIDDYPCLSPDGKHVAFVSNRDGDFEIYVLRLSDGSTHNVTNARSVENFPCWSPDGKLIFSSNRHGGFDLYLMALPNEE